MTNNTTDKNMEMNITVNFSPVKVLCDNIEERENGCFVKYFYRNQEPMETFDDFRNFAGNLDFDRYQTYKFTLFRSLDMRGTLKSGNVVAGKPSEDYYYNRNGIGYRNRVFDFDSLGLLKHYNISYELIVVQDKLPSVQEVLSHKSIPVQQACNMRVYPCAFEWQKVSGKKIARRTAYYTGELYSVNLFNPAKTVCVDKNLVEIRFPFYAEEMKNGFPGPGPIVYADEQYKTGKTPESLEGFFSKSPVLSIRQVKERNER